jgi:MoxR-like ATPase
MPKVKIVIKRSPRSKDSDGVKEAALSLTAVIKQINGVLIDKDRELEALQLCLMTKEHLLLDGLHGICKSRLAEELFARVTDAKIFRAQLNKGTEGDELFGPLDSNIYKTKAEWHRNTTGMLPEADIAFLDEVYRASDMLLGYMMSILNERTYMNGPVRMQCPLKTAIATCNFVTVNPELDAIHDRWMVRFQSTPLEKSALRFKMLVTEYQRRLDPPEEDSYARINLEELETLQRCVDRVLIEEEVIELYEELVQEFRKRREKVYISDRRLCKALRFAQAAFLLQNPNAVKDEVPITPDMLLATSFGITKVNEPKDNTAFGEAFEHVIGNYERMKQEHDDMETLTSAVTLCQEQFDDKLSKREGHELYEEVQKIQLGISAMPEDRKPRSDANKEKLTKVIDDLNSLIASLSKFV